MKEDYNLILDNFKKITNDLMKNYVMLKEKEEYSLNEQKELKSQFENLLVSLKFDGYAFSITIFMK